LKAERRFSKTITYKSFASNASYTVFFNAPEVFEFLTDKNDKVVFTSPLIISTLSSSYQLELFPFTNACRVCGGTALFLSRDLRHGFLSLYAISPKASLVF